MSNLVNRKSIPRENIPWYPKVEAKKCIGCKVCFNFCRHKVYAWDEDAKKSVVSKPFECVVGCSTCAGLCKEGAISFPAKSVIKDFV